MGKHEAICDNCGTHVGTFSAATAAEIEIRRHKWPHDGTGCGRQDQPDWEQTAVWLANMPH